MGVPFDRHHTCCRNQDAKCSFTVVEYFKALDAMDDWEGAVPTEVTDRLSQSYFEVDNVGVVEDIKTTYDALSRNGDVLSKPPQEFDAKHVLSCAYVDDPDCPAAISKNQAITEALNNRAVDVFIKLLWLEAFRILEEYIVADDPDNLVIKRKEFTEVTGQWYLFLTSATYVAYTKALFNKTLSLSEGETMLAGDVANQTFVKFLAVVSEHFRREETEEPCHFNVYQMTNVGLAKVRHVGAWAVRKVLDNCRKYVQKNVYSTSSMTSANVQCRFQMAQLIEENAIVPFAKLETESKYKETLKVTQERQYREAGLIHVSDAVYEFTLAMEQMRSNLMNTTTLRHLKGDLVKETLTQIQHSEELLALWRGCFNVSEKEVYFCFFFF